MDFIPRCVMSGGMLIIRATLTTSAQQHLYSCLNFLLAGNGDQLTPVGLLVDVLCSNCKAQDLRFQFRLGAIGNEQYDWRHVVFRGLKTVFYYWHNSYNIRIKSGTCSRIILPSLTAPFVKVKVILSLMSLVSR